MASLDCRPGIGFTPNPRYEFRPSFRPADSLRPIMWKRTTDPLAWPQAKTPGIVVRPELGAYPCSRIGDNPC